MQHTLIDSHCHLDHPRFDTDRPAVLQRARSAGVTGIVIPATHAASWNKLINLTLPLPHTAVALGLHPCFMEYHHEEDLVQLSNEIDQHSFSDNLVVAIGECGLDRLKLSATGDEAHAQIHFFDKQLHIAHEKKLPLIVHARGAVELVINRIRNAPSTTGVIHSYGGSIEQAEQLINLGYQLGIGGAMTYSNATKLHKLVACLPLNSMLIETDAPDQPDASHHGERNEPAYLQTVFQMLCKLRAESAEEIAQVTKANTIALFGLESWYLN